MTRITQIIVQLGIGLAILAVALPATMAGPEIPTDPTKVDSWYSETIGPAASRKSELDPDLATAEASPVVIKVRKDGSGQFESVQKALNSIKTGNKVRTIIDIGPGVYTEKITVEREKAFVTFLGDPKDMPTLSYNGVASDGPGGTDGSFTVFVNAEYFVASHIIFKNSSPRPALTTKNGQALALRIEADKATVYNCRLLGFQDTLGDDKYKHFYKDCYIEGTVDFVFGAARSIFLNCELHVIPGDNMAVVTAQYRENAEQEGAFVIVHSKVTGTGGYADLGRTWSNYPQVVILYSTLSDAVTAGGWNNHNNAASEKTAFFAEWENKGPGADTSKRVPWATKITEDKVKTFMTLDYIKGTMWLLPPPQAKGASASASAPTSDSDSASSSAPKSDSDSDSASAPAPSSEEA